VVGEVPVQINTISRTENGYLIDISGDFELIDISSPDREPDGVEFEVLDNGHKRLKLVYEGEVPAGQLTLELSSPVLKLDGPWQKQWQPDGNEVSNLTTVTRLPDTAEINPLVLEQVIVTKGGFILAGYFGSNEFMGDARILKTMQLPMKWNIRDNTGEEVPFMDVSAQYSDIHGQPKLGDNFFHWAIELYGKELNWPLSIEFTAVNVEYPNVQAEFVFDTGPDPHVGQTWDLNLDINLGTHHLRVVSAELTEDGYTFVAKSVNGIFQVHLEILDITDAGVRAGWNGHDQMDIRVQFPGEIPKGKLTIVLSDPKVELQGNWQTVWQSQGTLPHDGISTIQQTPITVTRACLTIDSWGTARTNPTSVPVNVSGKVIVEDVTFLSESENTHTTYFASLDGSNKKTIGKIGSWRSVSLDGSKIVYTDIDGLYVKNIVNGDTYHITGTERGDHNPIWAPDKEHIAFLRNSDAFIIRADGSDLKKIISEPEYERLFGWSRFGEELFYAVGDPDELLYKRLNLATGEKSELFRAEINHTNLAAISPDGNSIAFTDRIADVTFGLYVSSLTGLDRQLVAQMTISDNFWVSDPVWSPAGNWLVMNVNYLNKSSEDESGTALVDLNTCQVVQLPFTGQVISWIQ
jgi:hypothetical protein